MRAPPDSEIPAPEFPSGVECLHAPFVRVSTLLGRHALLIECWDCARVNKLRILPYFEAWHERYADAGLAVVGVHSPGYSFGRSAETVERAVERLGIEYPVALDPDFEIWRAYSVRGWPARYLFDRRG